MSDGCPRRRETRWPTAETLANLLSFLSFFSCPNSLFFVAKTLGYSASSYLPSLAVSRSFVLFFLLFFHFPPPCCNWQTFSLIIWSLFWSFGLVFFFLSYFLFLSLPLVLTLFSYFLFMFFQFASPSPPFSFSQ